MIFHTLLNHAVWLMRRMRFAGKLILLAALSALPLLAVAWQFLVGLAPDAGLAGVFWVSLLGLVLLVYFFWLSTAALCRIWGRSCGRQKKWWAAICAST